MGNRYLPPVLITVILIRPIWIFLLNPFGLFNEVRGVLGLNPIFSLLGYDPNQDWLGDYHTAMNGVIILNAWTTSGTMMLFYLAALQSIPTDVYEAAAIDGAGPWRTFWKVTFPLLKPAHFFVLVVSIIVDITRWRALSKVSRDTKSDALAADALHFSSDFIASTLVLLGLIAARYGYPQGDTFAAFGVEEIGRASCRERVYHPV